MYEHLSTSTSGGFSPPEYLMIDMHGTVPHGVAFVGHLIVYGVAGYAADVDPHVFDTPYLLENGKMVMETNLNMNSHEILNHNH